MCVISVNNGTILLHIQKDNILDRCKNLNIENKYLTLKIIGIK